MGNDTCIFCKIANGLIPSKKVFEDAYVVAFDDIKPQAPVHVLIIPKLHIEKASDLTDKDADLVAKMVLAAKNIAKSKGVEDSGYRIVINCNKDAGQDVFHLHLHLMGARKFTWPPG